MRRGISAIWQGVLWEENLCVYGMPNLLVRSVILGALCDSENIYPWTADGAPALSAFGYHKVVIGVKYGGFDDQVTRIVNESCRTLKFESSEFEEE
jgi:hypothetical protein